jgi:hypothetical protein
MKSQEQITDPKQIETKMIELQNIQKQSEEILALMNAIQIKLKVDLSPTCIELGQYASFMADCRDKFMPQRIMKLVVFIDSINKIGCLLNPANNGNSLNRDEQKRLAE